MAEARKAFGNAEIKFDVTYSKGSISRDANGDISTISGVSAGAINVVVSKDLGGNNLETGETPSGVYLTLINASNAKGALNDELAHHLSGDSSKGPSPFGVIGDVVRNDWADMRNAFTLFQVKAFGPYSVSRTAGLVYANPFPAARKFSPQP